MHNRVSAERIRNGVGGPMVLALVLIALCGCSSNESDNETSDDANATYSGNFLVRNEHARTITISTRGSWENFGNTQPAEGELAHGAEEQSSYPQMGYFPESTFVVWALEGDSEGEQSQTIDLKGVVPANTAGRTEFIFGADGEWSARFVPGEFAQASDDPAT